MTQVFTDSRCLLHRSPAGYPERTERLEGILARLRQSGFDIQDGCRHDEAEERIVVLHDEGYVERFQQAVARGDGLLDSADNPISEGTWDAAWAAVEVALSAVDAAVTGKRSFAAVRPPGHHAEHALAMGFCFFDNIAVAAEHALRRHGCERVAIYDFDVHHGNGTQHLFEERADVFFASTHQFPFYPGTGAAGETGRGRGEGYTLNVPLRAATGDGPFTEILKEKIVPALRDFRPDLLLISAGFDAWRGDPLGGLWLDRGTFHTLGLELGRLADEVCGGRLVSVLEGGYDLENLPVLVETYLRGCAGEDESP